MVENIILQKIDEQLGEKRSLNYLVLSNDTYARLKRDLYTNENFNMYRGLKIIVLDRDDFIVQVG